MPPSRRQRTLPRTNRWLFRGYIDEWTRRYVDSDPESRLREPAGVEASLGPFSEIIKAWQGPLPSIRQALPARSFRASMDL